MARTIESEPLHKHILLLYEGDWEKLRGYYPDLATGVVIRRIVREHILKIEAIPPSVPRVEIDRL